MMRIACFFLGHRVTSREFDDLLHVGLPCYCKRCGTLITRVQGWRAVP